METMGDTQGIAGTRRRILRLAGAVLAASALGRTATACTLDQQDVTRLFADPKAAAAIGRAYLRTQPTPTLEALRTAVMDALQGDPAVPPEQARLEARFRARVQQDFAAARVVMVDGWMLSRVEAQTCAYLNVAREI
jgi:hypothetical protein